jgi:hypothetical protein
MAYAAPRRFVVQLRDGPTSSPSPGALAAALAGRAKLVRIGGEDSEHYLLSLADDVVLGDAVASLAAANIEVLSCREERSEIEEAFLLLTEAIRE